MHIYIYIYISCPGGLQGPRGSHKGLAHKGPANKGPGVPQGPKGGPQGPGPQRPSPQGPSARAKRALDPSLYVMIYVALYSGRRRLCPGQHLRHYPDS